MVCVFLVSRTLIPIDETRYTAVAWEMWSHGNYLVPHLNGEPYSHKPPLLFWLIQAGWMIFGVNDWWPRLLPSLFSLASISLVYQFSRRLWPDRIEIAKLAPTLLIGSLLWIQFLSAAMFDMILSFWVLLAIYCIYQSSRVQRSPIPYWLLAGVATGLGLLTKGPVMLLHVLPLALLAPVWVERKNMSWVRWYTGIVGIVLLASLIILSWAIPAALKGGTAYSEAIFWGQTAHRIVHSIAHQRPWWWYLPILPVILFPCWLTKRNEQEKLLFLRN